MTDQAKQDRDEREVRLEKARKELLATLETLRGEMLTQKEADAVGAAIEDELIALRVGPFWASVDDLHRPCEHDRDRDQTLGRQRLANVEVKVGLSTEGVPRPRADLNVTSMAKAFPNPALQSP